MFDRLRYDATHKRRIELGLDCFAKVTLSLELRILDLECTGVLPVKVVEPAHLILITSQHSRFTLPSQSRVPPERQRPVYTWGVSRSIECYPYQKVTFTCYRGI